MEGFLIWGTGRGDYVSEKGIVPCVFCSVPGSSVRGGKKKEKDLPILCRIEVVRLLDIC